MLAVGNGADPGGLGATSTAKQTALQITFSDHLSSQTAKRVIRKLSFIILPPEKASHSSLPPLFKAPLSNKNRITLTGQEKLKVKVEFSLDGLLA